MRYVKFLLLLLVPFSLPVLHGCKKVIRVDLKNAAIRTVITGEVNNRPGPYRVTITKTVDFTSENNFPPVSGAFVTITGNGLTDTLSQTGPGVYSTHDLVGRPGKSYTLFVSAEGKQYAATSVMPHHVALDSVSFLGGVNNNIYAVANFQDPAGIANYYQFIEFIDGKRLNNGRGNSIFDDRLSDGRYISRLLYDDSSDIKPGITLTVQMNCVDQPVYEYLNELQQASGAGGGFSSPTPDNPASNISGGALGYFSAHTVSIQTMKLP